MLNLQGLRAGSAAIAAALVISLAPVSSAPAAPLLDELGRPSPAALKQLKELAKQPWLPERAGTIISAIVVFMEGTGNPGPPIPQGRNPLAQGMWPSVATKCIGGKDSSVGLFAAIPGPSRLPRPGVKPGQSAFIFTALGTESVSSRQKTKMEVRWVNLSNGRVGVTTLGYHGINQDGPATVNGTANTGKGKIFALVTGGITTDIDDGKTSNCEYFPVPAQYQVR